MSITISTITPVYSGEKYLPDLVKAIDAQKQQWKEEKAPLELTEAIFVTDGAIDNSLEVLLELSKQHSWVRVVSLSRNFGQHSATVAGICHSATDWVVTLDEDLQHHPKEIDTLFTAQAQKGADVVYAMPAKNVHGNSWRDLSSKLTKAILSKITGTSQIKNFNSFRLIRGNIARAAASSSSSQTYLDIALTWFTKSFTSISIQMEDERYITSKSSGYGLLKLIQHARKLVISSHVDVASSGMLLGIFAIFIAVVTGSFTILQKFFFPETIDSAGWASTISLITFFGGITISLLCIALEYINVLVVNQLGKPTFFVVEKKGDSILQEWFKPES